MSRVTYLIAGSIIVSAVLPLLTQLPPLEQFTPRAVIHSHHLAPAFLSSWAAPTNTPSWVARIAQITLILYLPAKSSTYGNLYLYSLLVAGARTVVGYFFSRSVGWAYPPLFSHWALYEPSSGFGPLVLARLALDGQEGLVEVLPRAVQHHARYALIPLLTFAFCWFEHAPWTYGVATLLCALVLLGQSAYSRSRLDYTWLAPSPDPNEEKPSPPTPLRVTLQSLALAFLAVLIPYALSAMFIPPSRLPFPSGSASPLLDIIVLSYPRPVDTELGAKILSSTLSSFVPHLSPGITLSAFTHSSSHPAFDQVHLGYPDIPFYTDRDSHPDDADDQYLHLAEAFRWAYEREVRAEWVMLVEDDFPLCEGGWGVVSTVMAMLEDRRAEGNIGSGMIGTGGSGLIIHHSRLRLLSSLLRLYSSHGLIPSELHRPPPDVLVQDCLIGRPGGICERDTAEEGRMIISSRLVLDHIGGMATTTAGKALNSDKWRCGWRSGLHGEEGVDVVVV